MSFKILKFDHLQGLPKSSHSQISNMLHQINFYYQSNYFVLNINYSFQKSTFDNNQIYYFEDLTLAEAICCIPKTR